MLSVGAYSGYDNVCYPTYQGLYKIMKVQLCSLIQLQ